jgi:hypothetical protein
MIIIRAQTDPDEEKKLPPEVSQPEDIAKVPSHGLPEGFPGDEDLDFLEEIVPSPADIEQPPEEFELPFKVPKGQQPGKPFYETMPSGFLEMEDWTYHPEGEPGPDNAPDVETVDPAEMFEEVVREETPLEEQNRQLNIREKIFESLNTGTPLHIRYRTLPDNMGRSSVTDRTVEPDYVYWPSTNRHLLMALDHLRGDWRSFAVDNIMQADLVGE